MEQSETNPELELLAKIHNHLVDIKKILVATQTNPSPELKTQLAELVASDRYADGAHGGASTPSHQKVIAPEHTTIEPGESREL